MARTLTAGSGNVGTVIAPAASAGVLFVAAEMHEETPCGRRDEAARNPSSFPRFSTLRPGMPRHPARSAEEWADDSVLPARRSTEKEPGEAKAGDARFALTQRLHLTDTVLVRDTRLESSFVSKRVLSVYSSAPAGEELCTPTKWRDYTATLNSLE